MNYANIRSTAVKEQVITECNKKCISIGFAECGADYAAFLLNERNTTIHRSIIEGLKVANAKQALADNENRVFLRMLAK